LLRGRGPRALDAVPRRPVSAAVRDQPLPEQVRELRAGARSHFRRAPAAARPSAALEEGRGGPDPASRGEPAVSARNRELIGLFPVAALITAGFTAVYMARSSELGCVSLTSGAIFLALCLGVHLFIRVTLPDADPYLFPLVALLAAFGLVMIY